MVDLLVVAGDDVLPSFMGFALVQFIGDGSFAQRSGYTLLVALLVNLGLFWCVLAWYYRAVCRVSVSVSSCFRVCGYSNCYCSCYFGIRVSIDIGICINVAISVFM